MQYILLQPIFFDRDQTQKSLNMTEKPNELDHDPADNILSLVHRLSNRIGGAFYSEVETQFGLSLGEWRVIMTLAHQPGSTAIDITNRWAMDKMAVNRAIKKLENLQHLKRRQNPNDRRSYNLSLTPTGRELYDKIVPTANNRYHELVSVLSHDELAGLNDQLSRLIDRAELLDK